MQLSLEAKLYPIKPFPINLSNKFQKNEIPPDQAKVKKEQKFIFDQ
jgi:hypothetical protein